MSESRIALSEMIAELRRELLKAQDEGQEKDLRLRVEEAEIEFHVTVTKEDSIGGSVKFWVFNADGRLKDADATTQKIKLKITPTTVSGGSFDMGDDSE